MVSKARQRKADEGLFAERDDGLRLFSRRAVQRDLQRRLAAVNVKGVGLRLQETIEAQQEDGTRFTAMATT